MADALKDPKVRVQLDLSLKQAERFDNLVTDCDLGSRKELFNVAMSLFYWATQEANRGRKIASYDEENDHVETVIVPALENISLHSAGMNPNTEKDRVPNKKSRASLGGEISNRKHMFAVK